MAKETTLKQNFYNLQKEINEAGYKLEPHDVYLGYIATALCVIADKLTEEKDDQLS